MPRTDRTTNNHSASRTTLCTRQKSLRNGPSYIFLSDSENSSPPPRMATPPTSQRLAAPTRTQSAKPTTRNVSPASNLPRSRLPRSTGTPWRSSPIARTPHDSAVWMKSSPAISTPSGPRVLPLNARKPSSTSKSSRMKPLPLRPIATVERTPSPAQEHHTILDTTEPDLSPSPFSVLTTTPSNTVLASSASFEERGSNNRRSRIPRATFWPGGRDSLTLSDAPAPAKGAEVSPGRVYSPPPTSYSTVRPVRNSAASQASFTSTPRKQIASHVQVRPTHSANLVAIPAATRPLQPVGQAVHTMDGEVAEGMVEEAAPAPVVHLRVEEADRGRKRFFTSAKPKLPREKSKSRMVLEKMTGLVRRRDSRAELKQQISRPISGSFVHLDASQGAPFAPTNSDRIPAIPPVPAMPAFGPLVPDRLPPPVPVASHPNARQSSGSTSKDLGFVDQEDQEPALDQNDKDEETNLLPAAQNLRTLANAAASEEVRLSFLNMAKHFTDTKIFVNEAAIAVEKAKRHADEAIWYYREVKENARKIGKIARLMRPSADLGDDEMEIPAPKLRTGLRTKTRTEMQARK